MAEIARWGGHKFEVSPNLIRSFSELTIKGSSEIEAKASGNQKYATRKNGNATEITLVAHLHAALGCDVQTEALAFVADAKAGAKDYFYIGGKKLLPYQMMLTSANVDEVRIMSTGAWYKADVSLTMQQCGKEGASSGTSAGKGSKKASVKTKEAKKNVKDGSETKEPGNTDAKANYTQQRAELAKQRKQAKMASASKVKGLGGKSMTPVTMTQR